MDIDIIKKYSDWAERGYHEPLTCPYHAYHRLIPVQGLEDLTLVCPRDDYSRTVGLKELSELKQKSEVAEFLWKMR